MADEKRKNVGAHAYELLQKEPETRDPHELQQEMQKYDDFVKELEACVEDAKRTYIGNFYVVVLTKREKLMPNAIRTYALARQSCPTPQFDQTVYFYDRSQGDLQYIWTVPDQHACLELYYNAHDVPREQHQLRDFVLEFYDGTLLRRAKEYNGEIKENHGSRISTAH